MVITLSSAFVSSTITVIESKCERQHTGSRDDHDKVDNEVSTSKNKSPTAISSEIEDDTSTKMIKMTMEIKKIMIINITIRMMMMNLL